MIIKGLLLLCVALCVNGHAISEQKVVKYIIPVHKGHHGELEHIGEHKPEHHDHYAWSHPKYEFAYKVEDPHTHDFKGQVEHRDGDVVKGEYWLIQPDGKKRTVKYHADKHTGFLAEVIYSHPQHHEYKLPEHEERHQEQEIHVEHHRQPEVEEVVVEEPRQEEPRQEEEIRQEEPRREEIIQEEHEKHEPLVVEHAVKIEHKYHKEHKQEHHAHHPIVHHEVRHKEHYAYPVNYDYRVEHHVEQHHPHPQHHYVHQEPEVRHSEPVRIHKPMVYEYYERPQAQHHDQQSHLRYYRHNQQ